MNVSLETLQDVLDSHGADAERWPVELRSELLALCERSAEARESRAAAGELDSLLDALPAPAPAGRLAETILGDLPPRAQVHRLPLRRWAALAMPLAAAAALALWFTGPLAPGGSPVGPAADLAGGIELTENTLGLAASDVFTWEVPSDAFLEVAKLDPLADVPSFGCTYEDDLGCLLLSPTAGTGQTRGPSPQRILT